MKSDDRVQNVLMVVLCWENYATCFMDILVVSSLGERVNIFVTYEYQNKTLHFEESIHQFQHTAGDVRGITMPQVILELL